jgi:hypothetical protein
VFVALVRSSQGARLGALVAALAGVSCVASPGTDEVSASSSQDLAVTGLFPTGVNASGAPAASGSTDVHYALSSNDLNFPGPAAIVVDPAGGWTGNTATSKWLSVATSTNGTTGRSYTYTTTFTLAGVNPTSATLTGKWSCDDSCVMQLHGTAVARPAAGAGRTGRATRGASKAEASLARSRKTRVRARKAAPP